MALTDNLISFWELEETSGTRVDSVTTTGNDLTDVNTVTSNPGKVGNAAQFVKINNEELTRADNASLSVGAGVSVTFTAWVYMDTLPANVGVLGKWAPDNEYALAYSAITANRFEFAVRNPANTVTTTSPANTFGAPSTATWYFIMAQYDQSNLRISVNNGVVDQVAYSAGIRDAAGLFRIGGYSVASWDGRIDQVGFWKRALTAAEITQLYNSGNGLSYAAMTAMASTIGYGSSPTIAPLGLINAGATATRLTSEVGLFCSVLGFQWVSGTVTIGDSTVTAGSANAYFNLDTTSRLKEIRSDKTANGNTLSPRDFFCIGSGSFICYYQCQ